MSKQSITFTERTKRRRVNNRVHQALEEIANEQSHCSSSNPEKNTPTQTTKYVHTEPSDKYDSDSSEFSDMYMQSDSDIKSSSIYVETDSEISTSDFEVEPDLFNNYIKNLTEWALNFGISHTALKSLLEIQRPFFPNLPKDPRTLLRTPSETPVKNLDNGLYHHFGVEKGIVSKVACCGLVKYSNKMIEQINISKTEFFLTLSLHFDGIPIFKSSNKQFWPILGKVDQAVDQKPFVIGLYYGTSKPNSANVYLDALIEELCQLEKHGIIIDGKQFCVRVSCIIADAPARSFIKCVKSHNSYYSCEKCTQTCEFISNRMVFKNDPHCKLRDDSSFRLHPDKHHQLAISPLTKISIGLVTQVILDGMHLVYLGVMRKMLFIWTGLSGKIWRMHRLSRRTVSDLSNDIIQCKQICPSDFSRKPRSLTELKYWKATEYRSFLLYIGPVVLKKHLPENKYNHFLLLHIAIYILCFDQATDAWINYANRLLDVFVQSSVSLYGRKFLVYNVHNLTHLSTDVKNFGPLDSYSAFKFENCLGNLKKMCRSKNHALQQVVNRILEIENQSECKIKLTQKNIPSQQHVSGPLSCDVPLSAVQYRKLISDFGIVSCREGDNCFMLCDSNELVLIKNICKYDGMFWGICTKINSKTESLYKTSFFESNLLNILKVESCSNNNFISVPIEKLRKCYTLPIAGSNLVACIPFVSVKQIC
jgi:hypothetical protein